MIISSTQAGSQTPQIPKGLQHRYIKVGPARRLAVLCRQMRADINS